ncbi:hypothetical protein KI387_031733, partial [Taxus chinensis]
VGVVSDEKLLDLLELALSADTVRTVRRTRELIDSGIEPMTLMSQLATLIMDILAGSYKFGDIKCKGIFFHRHALTEEELERLRRALKILSEAEKQLRVSNDQTTWLTAALLQFGSGRSHLVPTSSGTSVTQSPAVVKKRNNNGLLHCGSSSQQLLDNQEQFEASLEHMDSVAMPNSVVGNADGSTNKAHITFFNESCKGISDSSIKAQIHELGYSPRLGSCGRSFLDGIDDSNDSAQPDFSCMSPSKLDDLWRRTIEECRSKTLRQLCTQGKLVSVSMGRGFAIVQLEFWNPDKKSIAERYVKSIASSVKFILGCDVEIRIDLASVMVEFENTTSRKTSIELPKYSANEQRDLMINSIADQGCESTAVNSDYRTRRGETCMEAHYEISRTESFSEKPQGYYEGFPMLTGCAQANELQTISRGENNGPNVVHDGMHEASKIRNGSVTDEQKLESAWLQAVEKCAPGLKDILKPEKNQLLSQDVIDLQNGFASSGGIGTLPLGAALQQKDGMSCHAIRAMKPNGSIDIQKFRCAKTNHSESLCSSSFDQGSFVARFEEEN